MHHVTRIDGSLAQTPPGHAGRSRGFRRQVLVDSSTGSPHMSLSVGFLDAHGSVPARVHSFEQSLYVMAGTLRVVRGGSTTVLGPQHAIVVPVGVTYELHAGDEPVQWLNMAAPAEIADGRREDTFFTGETLIPGDVVTPDMRDPRNRDAVRFDPESMDLRRLAGGTDVNAPTASPSMATALLAYSGIGVKMLVDSQLGAYLHTMFVVDYQPTAIAHPHDHPFEEAYVFVEGEVHALVDGELIVMHPGDVLWAGVGADHGFENRSDGLVRWIEYQAPQPPLQHSYRFSREWEHVADKLGHGHHH